MQYYFLARYLLCTRAIIIKNVHKVMLSARPLFDKANNSIGTKKSRSGHLVRGSYSFITKFLKRPEEPNPVQIPIDFVFVEDNLSTVKTGSVKSLT